MLGCWPTKCPHCGTDWCAVNEPPHCWWDHDGLCSDCGRHPFTASKGALEEVAGYLPTLEAENKRLRGDYDALMLQLAQTEAKSGDVDAAKLWRALDIAASVIRRMQPVGNYLPEEREISELLAATPDRQHMLDAEAPKV